MKSSLTSFLSIILFVIIAIGLYILAQPSISGSCIHNFDINNIINRENDTSEKFLPIAKDESNIPILMYHHIKDTNKSDNEIEKGLSVSIENFTRQIEYLHQNNFQTIKLNNLFTESDYKKVIITFDDGYKDVIENALPILEKYGFIAHAFIITDYIDKNDYLNWADIHKLETLNWVIGSHSITHPNLTNISKANARDQINYSKKILENRLNNPIDFFSYPAGKYNNDIIKIIKQAGYTATVSTDRGTKNTKNDLYKLKRIRISGHTSLEQFINILN